MAARLKIANTKAGRIFRGLFGYDNGTFERDVLCAVEEWLLKKNWQNLEEDTMVEFRKKVKSRARRCWPHDLLRDGNFKWLYHNHCVYSGNVPYWADWKWPDSDRWKEGNLSNIFVIFSWGRIPGVVIMQFVLERNVLEITCGVLYTRFTTVAHTLINRNE